MSTTIGNLKLIGATYLGRTSASDLTVNGFDVGLFALNAARRKVERLADFRYAEINGSLSITSSGGALSAVTGLGSGSTVKRVINVELPVTSPDYIPVEFLTEREWTDRITRQIGRSVYIGTATLASLGVSNSNPIAYQQAQTLFLVPASQFTFPVAARINCVRFMPDYTADADTDFFTQWAPEYLQWQSILEMNKFFRRFAPKEEEATIDEKAVEAMANEALQTLLDWNAQLDGGTSTPPGTDAPKG